jgi:hypothetical protein
LYHVCGDTFDGSVGGKVLPVLVIVESDEGADHVDVSIYAPPDGHTSRHSPSYTQHGRMGNTFPPYYPLTGVKGNRGKSSHILNLRFTFRPFHPGLMKAYRGLEIKPHAF